MWCELILCIFTFVAKVDISDAFNNLNSRFSDFIAEGGCLFLRIQLFSDLEFGLFG